MNYLCRTPGFYKLSSADSINNSYQFIYEGNHCLLIAVELFFFVKEIFSKAKIPFNSKKKSCKFFRGTFYRRRLFESNFEQPRKRCCLSFYRVCSRELFNTKDKLFSKIRIINTDRVFSKLYEVLWLIGRKFTLKFLDKMGKVLGISICGRLKHMRISQDKESDHFIIADKETIKGYVVSSRRFHNNNRLGQGFKQIKELSETFTRHRITARKDRSLTPSSHVAVALLAQLTYWELRDRGTDSSAGFEAYKQWSLCPSLILPTISSMPSVYSLNYIPILNKIYCRR